LFFFFVEVTLKTPFPSRKQDVVFISTPTGGFVFFFFFVCKPCFLNPLWPPPLPPIWDQHPKNTTHTLLHTLVAGFFRSCLWTLGSGLFRFGVEPFFCFLRLLWYRGNTFFSPWFRHLSSFVGTLVSPPTPSLYPRCVCYVLVFLLVCFWFPFPTYPVLVAVWGPPPNKTHFLCGLVGWGSHCPFPTFCFFPPVVDPFFVETPPCCVDCFPDLFCVTLVGRGLSRIGRGVSFILSPIQFFFFLFCLVVLLSIPTNPIFFLLVPFLFPLGLFPQNGLPSVFPPTPFFHSFLGTTNFLLLAGFPV